MQSTPTLKDTDPHDVFAIESLLHAHAEKAPTLAHDPAAPSAAPQVHVAPPISVAAPTPQVEPTFRAPDLRDIQVENVRVENVRPSEIKVDGLKPPGERPMGKWAKRLVMALLGLCGAMAAAAWQQYGDQAKAMAAEWAPPFVLAALPSATRPAAAEQPSAPAIEAAASDQATAQQPVAAAPASAQPEPTAAAAPSAESAQLQSMALDLAKMGQQVEELKTTVAQLRASQAQMAREFAKASEAKAADTRPAEQNLRPRVSALTPPPPRPAAPPPVRKPKPAYSASPSYAPAPIALPQRRFRRCRPPHRCRLRRPSKRSPMTASRWCARRCRCGSKPATRSRFTARALLRSSRRARIASRGRIAPIRGSSGPIARNSALVRSPHQLHGVLDMAPLPGFIGIALALASLRIVGGLRDRGETVLLHHLARNRVDLHFRHHVALPGFHQSTPQHFARCGLLVKRPNRKSRSARRRQIIFDKFTSRFHLRSHAPVVSRPQSPRISSRSLACYFSA